MKILTIGPSGGFGGLETHFKLLNCFLVNEGYSVFQCHVFKKGYQSHIRVDRNDNQIFALYSFKGIIDKTRAIFDMLLFIYKARIFNPDIVISSAIGFRYVIIGLLISRKSVKLYQEVIGDIPLYDLLRTLMVFSYSNVACQSEKISQRVKIAVKPKPRITTLPCFCNPIGERYQLSAKKPTQYETVRFCYVGRFASNKGLVQMMEAFCNANCYYKSELHVHGSGPLLVTLSKLKCDIDVANRIFIHGAYSGDHQLASIMSNMHGLILTSQFKEGLPLVLLESMSLGLPFLATNICGLPDAAKGNPDCLLCEKDEISIRDGIDLMYDKLKLGHFNNLRLREFYAKKFHTSIIKSQWRAFLKSPLDFWSKHNTL